MELTKETAAVDAAAALKSWLSDHPNEVSQELRELLQNFFVETYQILPDDPDKCKLRGVLANASSILLMQGMSEEGSD